MRAAVTWPTIRQPGCAEVWVSHTGSGWKQKREHPVIELDSPAPTLSQEGAPLQEVLRLWSPFLPHHQIPLSGVYTGSCWASCATLEPRQVLNDGVVGLRTSGGSRAGGGGQFSGPSLTGVPGPWRWGQAPCPASMTDSWRRACGAAGQDALPRVRRAPRRPCVCPRAPSRCSPRFSGL